MPVGAHKSPIRRKYKRNFWLSILSIGAEIFTGGFLLLEDGDFILLETGDKILLEDAT